MFAVKWNVPPMSPLVRWFQSEAVACEFADVKEREGFAVTRCWLES